ncbi:hypothetical protein, partial [Puniceibacterium antarcticum]|uniref:hypothetical protein n=1 Tax=Puniceibacterium antarcticum TaxID=1206336 RepID=UPI001C55685D
MPDYSGSISVPRQVIDNINQAMGHTLSLFAKMKLQCVTARMLLRCLGGSIDGVDAPPDGIAMCHCGE